METSYLWSSIMLTSWAKISSASTSRTSETNCSREVSRSLASATVRPNQMKARAAPVKCPVKLLYCLSLCNIITYFPRCHAELASVLTDCSPICWYCLYDVRPSVAYDQASHSYTGAQNKPDIFLEEICGLLFFTILSTSINSVHYFLLTNLLS